MKMADENKKPVETEKKADVNTEIKGEEKKEKIKETGKKDGKKKKSYATAYGENLSISPKVGKNICDMIRGKKADTAIKMTEDVIAFKIPVRMNDREASHQHGKGVMAGAYPIKACKEFLRMLKHLKANAIYNELDLEKSRLSCKADKASLPYKRGGARFKRANVFLKLQMKEKTEGAKKEGKEAEKKDKMEKKKAEGEK